MRSESSGKIQLLPEHIIDQIKAGEVIERPSTLLKELLENSVDAGATKIEIEIQNNGLDLVSVKDNGKGIPFEDLDLAFCRHATSKIEKFEDLYSLFTYGFRGEALASIASVSKLTCSSKVKNEPEGLIRIHGGETVTLNRDEEPEDSSGTHISIRELFYNTPARMKFIQSKTSEKNQLEKIIKAFLLTQPEIEFVVKWDNQDKALYPARSEENIKERVSEAIRKNRPLHLREFSSSYDGIDFQVFLSRESSRGNAGKSQFLFVNDRLVQDIQIHKIILNSAQKLWPLGETGNYCAYLNLPADALDVNIHPNKIQVKFYEPAKIFSLVSSVIKEGLAKSSETASSHAPAPQRFEFENDEGKNLGEVSYRSYEFSSGDASLERYFGKLDGRSEEKEISEERRAFEVLADFHDIILANLDGQPYIINGPQLIQAWLQKEMERGDISPTPLLVSQPLEEISEAASKKLPALLELGFEIDRLGSQDYVLRSFPQCLKHFPYASYLKSYLRQNVEELWEATPSWEDGWSRHLSKAAASLGKSELIKRGVASVLTKEKLKKIL